MFRSATIRTQIIITLILGTLLTALNQWSAVVAGDSVQWLPTLSTYALIFITLHLLDKRKSLSTMAPTEAMGSVSPQHINALYKQAMIVERNARKANAAFTNQLKSIQALLEHTKQLDSTADFAKAHQDVVDELQQLEKRIGNILKEMEKNVKLGEKLQQSVANIDPEIGIL